MMPLPDNGGGLLAWLIAAAVIGLAMLTRYATRTRCGACGEPVGDRPRYWCLTSPLGRRYAAPQPRCRDCFAAGR